MTSKDTAAERLILDVFATFEVGAGEYLPIQSLMANVMNRFPEWGYVERVVDQLVTKGLVKRLHSPPGLVLTAQGAARLYGGA